MLLSIISENRKNNMKKKKTIKIIIISIVSVLVIGGGIILYLFNMPHRDVKNASTDYQVEASVLVTEYLNDAAKANEKYLDEEGDSKIFEVSGVISEITIDGNNQTVVLLKNKSEKAGVSCTFTEETNKEAQNLKVGQKTTIKGVIRAGATYDSDLEMYEHVIIEKASIVK